MVDNAEIEAKRLSGQKWYEIDNEQDLDIASIMFCPNEDNKVELMEERYGGYGRFPSMPDFCYLVNPYYPPQKLFDEMKASFEILMSQYPSGMKVNVLLASKKYGISSDCIVIGNGASELIRSVLMNFGGKMGIIKMRAFPRRLRR